MASRLQQVLPWIISTDQTGYLRGRTVATNIRLMEDIFVYTDKYKQSGAAIFCDFEKAFDTVEISFVKKVLSKLGCKV